MADVMIQYTGTSVKTAADLARRYRVMAALHPEGVTMKHMPGELQAMAQAFEAIDQASAVVPLVIEVDRPVSGPMGVLVAFILAFVTAAAMQDALMALVALLGWAA